MDSRNAVRQPFVLGVMLAVLAIGVGCDETVVPPPEPDVQIMRLIVGTGGTTDTVLVTKESGAITGGPVTIPTGNTAIRAEFLRADGQPDPLVTAQEFELRITPANAAVVTFTRTSAFAGTLNGLQAGSTTGRFEMYHVEEMHADFEHTLVPITVQ